MRSLQREPEGKENLLREDQKERKRIKVCGKHAADIGFTKSWKE